MTNEEITAFTSKIGELTLNRPILLDSTILYRAGPLFLGPHPNERGFPQEPDLDLMKEWYENMIALIAEDNIFITHQMLQRYRHSNAIQKEQERLDEIAAKHLRADQRKQTEAIKIARRYHQDITQRLSDKQTTSKVNPQLIDLATRILRNLGKTPGINIDREELVATAFAHAVTGTPCAIASYDPYMTKLFTIYTVLFFIESSPQYATRTNPDDIELYKFRITDVEKISAAKHPNLKREFEATPRQITEMITGRINNLLEKSENDPLLDFYKAPQ